MSDPVETRLGERDDDQSLVEQYRRGDPEAFAALVRRHQRMIYALTFRMTGSLADADDLAQEVFIQAWRQLDSFRAEARFSSWLYRIAINRCLNWQKQSRRQAQLRGELPGACSPRVANSNAGCSRLFVAMIDSELNRLLKSAAVPERPADYWEDFPERIAPEIARTAAAGAATARTPRQPRLAWALDLAERILPKLVK